MTDHSTIAAGVALVPALKQRLGRQTAIECDYAPIPCEHLNTIIAALTVAGEMVGERRGWKLPEWNDLTSFQKVKISGIIAHSLEHGEYPQTYSSIREFMLSAAPASPDVVERAAKAIHSLAHGTEPICDDCRDYARAAIAAIGRT